MAQKLVRGSRLAEYELLLPVGHGGMADVWAARAPDLDPDGLFAIKVIHQSFARRPEFVRMFFEEAELLKTIRHPNVVGVYGVQQTANFVFMVMEWIEGDSLHSLIAEAGKRRPIPPELAVRIIADAASGLHAAHELYTEDGLFSGVIHRDVSPHNILIRTDGIIKLVDFGVAKVMGGFDGRGGGQLKGKFGYMSPEQALGLPLDPRSDIFSLGIVLFELTTGRRLFLGRTEAETMQLVISGDVPSPGYFVSAYPQALERIVMRALERRFQDRYSSAEEFRWELEGFLRQERVVVPTTGVGALLERVLGRRINERRRNLMRALEAADPDFRSRTSHWGRARRTDRGGSTSAVQARGRWLEAVRRWASAFLG
jgi:eukaryotic-like serine/threonine-protein kinase